MSPEEAIARLRDVKERALADIAEAPDSAAARAAAAASLGRRSVYSEIKRALAGLDEGARREVGRLANEVRADIEAEAEARAAAFEGGETAERLTAERLDVTLPGRRPPSGVLNPVTRMLDEIVEAFLGLGFSVVEGPEVETDYYNFQALNIPEDHPARSLWDTLYVDTGSPDLALVRTHTSPVQVRVMEKTPPPVYVIVPGRCARRDVPTPKYLSSFMQVEGLAVDYGISFADLRGTLEAFAKAAFGPEQRVRLIPDYFPFTEPSAGVEVLCFVCSGRGCRTCKNEGWIEILGAGMVHPNVFREVGYPPEITGFAFGMGVERVAMLRYGVSDIRWFQENDLAFLEAF
ncbi:MAG: phenylalanine--tRNA ligase subunit alpha [Actinomycetota bacterium]